MAFEIPYDEIRELQISLRKQAGLSSYHTEEDEKDTSLPNLPSLQDAISQLDPSPSHLRCEHCYGKLLRGVDSVICIFCGRKPNKDVPPCPIKFTSTFGYRWFLQSLDLDGSELVTPSVEANDSNRRQNTPEVELPLSDLLNLEIRWPSVPQKFDCSVLEKKPTRVLNLAGIDFDNYFTESEIDSVHASSERQFASNKHGGATESNAIQRHENLSLFENVEHSETVAVRKEDETGDSFSGWKADFQSAGAGTQHQEPNFSDFQSAGALTQHQEPSFSDFRSAGAGSQHEESSFLDPRSSGAGCQHQEPRFSDFRSSCAGAQHQEPSLSDFPDPFVGSSSVDLSSQIDAVFGPGNDLSGKEQKESVTSASNMNDWFEDDIWSNANVGAAVRSDQFEVSINDEHQRMVGNAGIASSMNVDLIQDNQWQTSTSRRGTSNKTDDEDDDSFDTWNDFTSSSSIQAPHINFLKDDKSTEPAVERASEMGFFSGNNSSKEVHFGGSSQRDFFSSASSNQNCSAEMNAMAPESSVSDKTTSMNGTHGWCTGDIEKSETFSTGNTDSKARDVETLISQMHDLSFMLERDLSVPQKKDVGKIDQFSTITKD